MLGGAPAVLEQSREWQMATKGYQLPPQDGDGLDLQTLRLQHYCCNTSLQTDAQGPQRDVVNSTNGKCLSHLKEHERENEIAN